jgi:hypothetical protein
MTETNQTEKCEAEKWRLLFFRLRFLCLVVELTLPIFMMRAIVLEVLFDSWRILSTLQGKSVNDNSAMSTAPSFLQLEFAARRP